MLIAPLTRLTIAITFASIVLSITPYVVVRSRNADARQGQLRSGISQTANMRVPRMAHTATTLRDGRILVAGGFTTEAQAAQSAEVFDAVNERFLPLPRMRALRHSHTATLLPTGKVLIVGGYADGGRTRTEAELFDPSTNTFTATGSLATARAGHIAVALRDGTVLIAGGVGDDWRFLSTAERYDPATGRFSATGPMTLERESHTAVLLHDGQVLITGGHRGRRTAMVLYASTELFDPATGTFRRSGEMHVRRHKHDAVVLADGRVLVSGGSDERDNANVYRSTELFNSATGTFSAGPALSRGRYKHNGTSVLLPTGQVLLAGGASQAELFTPREATFEIVAGADHIAGQFSAVAALRTGQVLITGGYGDDRGPQASAWIYRP